VIEIETPDHIRLESDRRLAISVTAILLCLNLMFVILNLRDSGPAAQGIPPVVVVRLAGVLIAALVTALLGWAPSQQVIERVSLAGAMAVVALLLTVQWLSRAGDPPSFAFDLVFVTAIFVALPGKPALQLVPALSLIFGATWMLLRPLSHFSDTDKLRYSFFFAGALALGYVAATRRAELWRNLISARHAEWNAAIERDRAKSELQSLRGIIPICSHCHRVRLEDGRLWEAVDMYVSRRTDAAFSHGVCPDCLSEHYPNVRADG
jgi:hypothetical protein